MILIIIKRTGNLDLLVKDNHNSFETANFSLNFSGNYHVSLIKINQIIPEIPLKNDMTLQTCNK